MELLKIVGQHIRGASIDHSIKEGSLVQVKMARKTGPGSYLVEIRGRSYMARLQGPVPGDHFIARVQSTNPQIMLKYVRNLDTGGSVLEHLHVLLERKNLSVTDFLRSRSFFEHAGLVMPMNRKRMKEALKQEGSLGQKSALRRLVSSAIRGQLFAGRSRNGSGTNASSRLSGRTVSGQSSPIERQIGEHLALQHLLNFLDTRNVLLIFPLVLGQNKALAHLKVMTSREGGGSGLLVDVTLEDGTKINFLVFIDYEQVTCSVSASDPDMAGSVEQRLSQLRKGIRSVCSGKTVEVKMVPYTDYGQKQMRLVKRVDFRM